MNVEIGGAVSLLCTGYKLVHRRKSLYNILMIEIVYRIKISYDMRHVFSVLPCRLHDIDVEEGALVVPKILANLGHTVTEQLGVHIALLAIIATRICYKMAQYQSDKVLVQQSEKISA